KEAFGVADHPDPELLLKLGIDSKREVLGESDLEGVARFEDGSREEKAEKHQKIGGQVSPDTRPDDSPPCDAVWRLSGRTLGGLAFDCTRLSLRRSSSARRTRWRRRLGSSWLRSSRLLALSYRNRALLRILGIVHDQISPDLSRVSPGRMSPNCETKIETTRLVASL